MRAKQGQCFLDLVIQGAGSLDEAFAMSLTNGVSVDASLAIGQEVKVSNVVNKNVVRLFTEDREPATALTQFEENVAEPAEGIGDIIIEQNFIVY